MSLACSSGSNILTTRGRIARGWAGTGVMRSRLESSFEMVSMSSTMDFWCCTHKDMVRAASMHASMTAGVAVPVASARTRCRLHIAGWR